MSKYNDYKYKILEILQTEYSADKSKALKEEIPKILNVSKKTFINWVYLKKDKSAEIRYTDLHKIAVILNTTVENLINFDIDFEVVKPNKL
jgi:DNA-binding Xre family transcriptional regulator